MVTLAPRSPPTTSSHPRPTSTAGSAHAAPGASGGARRPCASAALVLAGASGPGIEQIDDRDQPAGAVEDRRRCTAGARVRRRAIQVQRHATSCRDRQPSLPAPSSRAQPDAVHGLAPARSSTPRSEQSGADGASRCRATASTSRGDGELVEQASSTWSGVIAGCRRRSRARLVELPRRMDASRFARGAARADGGRRSPQEVRMESKCVAVGRQARPPVRHRRADPRALPRIVLTWMRRVDGGPRHVPTTRTASATRSDVAREQALRDHGLECFEVVGGDLQDRELTVKRMAAARARSHFATGSRRTWTCASPPGGQPGQRHAACGRR